MSALPDSASAPFKITAAPISPGPIKIFFKFIVRFLWKYFFKTLECCLISSKKKSYIKKILISVFGLKDFLKFFKKIQKNEQMFIVKIHLKKSF